MEPDKDKSARSTLPIISQISGGTSFIVLGLLSSKLLLITFRRTLQIIKSQQYTRRLNTLGARHIIKPQSLSCNLEC